MIEEKKISFRKEKLWGIPETWSVNRLGDLCDKIQDGNYGGSYPKKEEFQPEGVPFLTSKAIGKSGELNNNKIDFITEEKHLILKKAHLKLNDILFTNRGASVGAIGIVDESISNGNIGPQLTLLRPNKNIIQFLFLFQVMKSHLVQRQIKTQDSGSAMNFFGIKDTKNFKIPLPPLKEQQKIAQILSQWDKAIETTQTLIEKLQVRKKGLMQELLTGKKRLPGFSEEWKILRGDELFASISNKKHDGEFEVLSATQDKGVIPRSETGIGIKYDKKSLGNYKKLDIGDFVISLRSFQGGIEYSNYEGLVSPAYTVLREKLPIAKKFYQEYMKTENFINRLNSIIYGIRDGKQISYKEFGSLKFEYPPLKEQKAISKIISLADTEIEERKAYLLKLREQKKGLMQQLLTGKKRVKL